MVGGHNDAPDNLGDHGHYYHQGQDQYPNHDEGYVGKALLLAGKLGVFRGVQGIIHPLRNLSQGIQAGDTLVLHQADGLFRAAGIGSGENIVGGFLPAVNGLLVFYKLIILQGIDAFQGCHILVQGGKGGLDGGKHLGVIGVIRKQQNVAEIPGRNVGVDAGGLNQVAGFNIGVDHLHHLTALLVHQKQRRSDDDDGNQKGDPEP